MFDFFKKKPKPEPVKNLTLAESPEAEPHSISQPPVPSVHENLNHEITADTPPFVQNDEPEQTPPLDIALHFEQTPPPQEILPESAVKKTISASFFARTFGSLFSRNPKLDAELLDELETALITGDVGVRVSAEIMADIRKRFKAREFADSNELLAALRKILLDILTPVSLPLVIDAGEKPFVLLTVGVNGVGKTTTIGKLARKFQTDGQNVMLAAGDTFRAAAVEQLHIWGERNGVTVISQGQDADPASVAFDALQAAKSRGFDILIADTAGRLHTQTHLMAELSKIKRVLTKVDADAPHEVLLVIDGTTGQNAISQCRAFNDAVGVTGLVVTKLDGSAKGGVLFALAREFGIPIRFIGLGEKPEDLRVFEPQPYVDALLPQTL